MTNRERAVERWHILRTMRAIERPATAGEIRSRANEECSVEEGSPLLDEVDALPMLSPQGITAKLSSLSLASLVAAAPNGDGVLEWCLTEKGREAAESEAA